MPSPLHLAASLGLCALLTTLTLAGVEGGDRIEVHITVFNPDGTSKAKQTDHIEFKFDEMIEAA